MMAAKEVSAALSSMRRPDPEILHEAVGEPEVGLRVIPLLERAAEGELLTLPEERLVFFGLHVLAAGRETAVYRPLIRLLHRADPIIERLFDGNVTAFLPGIVISVFDGDPAPLMAAVSDKDVDGLIRSALFNALAGLCTEGAVSRETIRALVVRFDDERLAEPHSIAWFGWQETVAMLGFTDLADRVRAYWADESQWIAETERKDWEEILDRSARDPAGKGEFVKRGLVPIVDPVIPLEGMDGHGILSIAVPELANDPLARVALDGDELGWLDYFLRSAKVPADTGLEEVDGLFAALISGPGSVAPSEAIEAVWDGADQQPDFDSAEQSQYVLGLLTRHWNVIAARLARGAPYQPLIIGSIEEEYGRPWARGFIRGVMMREDDWQPLIDDEKERVNLLPMFILEVAAEDEGEAEDDDRDHEVIAEEEADEEPR